MSEIVRRCEVWPVVPTPFTPENRIDRAACEKLLEWYLAAGVDGLFTVCLSSEMFQLSEAERLELARFTVKTVAGRVPVVAGAGLEGDAEERIASVLRMAETGVAGVVQPLSTLIGPEEPEAVLLRRFEELFRRTGGVPVGLYECPVPHHRLFSTAALGEVIRMGEGRVRFFKDTCCSPERIRERLAVTKATSLRLYNANLNTLLASLRIGADGFCGLLANFFPALLVELCHTFRENPERAERIQAFLSAGDDILCASYPRGAKAFLSAAIPGFGTGCRTRCGNVSAEQLREFDRLRREAEKFA